MKVIFFSVTMPTMMPSPVSPATSAPSPTINDPSGVNVIKLYFHPMMLRTNTLECLCLASLFGHLNMLLLTRNDQTWTKKLSQGHTVQLFINSRQQWRKIVFDIDTRSQQCCGSAEVRTFHWSSFLRNCLVATKIKVGVFKTSYYPSHFRGRGAYQKRVPYLLGLRFGVYKHM